MRTIKFRAWRPSSKLMMPANSLLDLLSLSNGCGGLVDAKEVLWMQFTGLQDKNGVDIYEGDILCCYPDDFNLSYHKTVEWANDRCELGITTNGRSGVILCKSASDNYEVIGNIHSNPELLEQ